jgi:hypothetical protein
MKKESYFASKVCDGWPEPKDIEHYFLGPPDKRWFFETRNDSGSFTLEGAEGTGHLARGKGGRIEINLFLFGHRKFGVHLNWEKWDGKKMHSYASKGDLKRLHELIRTPHGDSMPVGLYIPYETAWKAVKEFLENDGALPKSIEWVNYDDLPTNIFPDPWI